MNAAELLIQADRCRRLAAQADNLTRDRLLKLAQEYDERATLADKRSDSES